MKFTNCATILAVIVTDFVDQSAMLVEAGTNKMVTTTDLVTHPTMGMSPTSNSLPILLHLCLPLSLLLSLLLSLRLCLLLCLLSLLPSLHTIQLLDPLQPCQPILLDLPPSLVVTVTVVVMD